MEHICRDELVCEIFGEQKFFVVTLSEAPQEFCPQNIFVWLPESEKSNILFYIKHDRDFLLAPLSQKGNHTKAL